MFSDFTHWLSSGYADLILMFFASSAIGEFALLLGAIAIGVVFMVLGVRLAIKSTSWLRFFTLPLLIISVLLPLILGINGSVKYQSNFQECVQVMDMTKIEERPVLHLHCRTRDTMDSEYGVWEYRNSIVDRKYTNVEMVSELP